MFARAITLSLLTMFLAQSSARAAELSPRVPVLARFRQARDRVVFKTANALDRAAPKIAAVGLGGGAAAFVASVGAVFLGKESVGADGVVVSGGLTLAGITGAGAATLGSLLLKSTRAYQREQKRVAPSAH